MRGKKFNAAEIHFQKKEIKMRQETNQYKYRIEQLTTINVELSIENEKLLKENIEIKTKYEKLLEYSKLSEDELKKALQSDKTAEKISTLLNITKQFPGGY